MIGIAYKPDIADPRESPAFEILELLLQMGAAVSYHDPHIPKAPRMRTWPDLPPLESVELASEKVEEQDAVLIVTNHSVIDYDALARHAKLIVDTRGVYRSGEKTSSKLDGGGWAAAIAVPFRILPASAPVVYSTRGYIW